MSEQSMVFIGNGRASVEFYECGSTTPSGTKMIYWGNGVGDGGAP
jgi:hypothetical protein